MNLDELRSVQSKERQTDSLQHLRESFYADVSAYISELENERDRAAEQADDPFADPQVRQLTDEIETAREVVEAIYDRRLGKLVKRASLAAADIPADEEGLTAEERELFDDLVERIEHSKAHVLDVLDADDPGAAQPSDAVGTTVDEATPGAAPGEASTAERGREDRAAAEAEAVATPESADDSASETGGDATRGDGGGASADPSPPAGAGGPREHGRTSEPAGERAGTAGESGSADAGLDTRTTVRITGDVDEFYGIDEREYDLDAEDVVTLPSDNAEPLLQSGDAERLE